MNNENRASKIIAQMCRFCGSHQVKQKKQNLSSVITKKERKI